MAEILDDETTLIPINPNTTSPLHALIIGINTYPDESLGNLSCAVNDAQAFSEFLKSQLHVSPTNIHLLFDEHATHDGIIDGFRQHLTCNPRIAFGDPIVFYYAGHGSQYLSPPSWNTDDGQFEAICPTDRGTVDPKTGATITDIGDHTLGNLLLELSKAKGDNVTVIMDCCHSGSGTRAPVKFRPRLAPPLEDEAAVLAMLRESSVLGIEDQDELENTTRHARPISFKHSSLATHVLLAACLQGELAYEHDDGSSGLFTSALIAALGAAHLQRLTYTTLIASLDIQPRIQHPQCEGQHKHRALFNGRAFGANRRLVPLSTPIPAPGGNEQKPILRVEAGAMHGVVPGTVFGVYPHKFCVGEAPHARVVTRDVHAVWSFVDPLGLDEAAPPSPTVATATAPGTYAGVLLWANDRDPVSIAFGGATESRNLARDIMTQGRKAGLEVAVDEIRDEEVQGERRVVPIVSLGEHEITVERRDSDVPAPRMSWPIRLPGDALAALNRVARFEMHLRRHNPARPLGDSVTMRFCRHGAGRADPLGSDGHLRIRDDDAEYVILLENHSERDLWVSLHYFDPGEYSVHCMYAPPSATMRAPLRAGQQLALGEGSSGVEPFEFVLRDDEKEDSGWVKAWLSDEYADLSMMEELEGEAEEMDFNADRAAGTRAAGASSVGGVWDTLTAVITISKGE